MRGGTPRDATAGQGVRRPPDGLAFRDAEVEGQSAAVVLEAARLDLASAQRRVQALARMMVGD